MRRESTSYHWKSRLPCDGTMRLTTYWLHEEGITDTEEALAQLAGRGAGCDCEVLLNVAAPPDGP
jgi:hypothetical protein